MAAFTHHIAVFGHRCWGVLDVELFGYRVAFDEQWLFTTVRTSRSLCEGVCCMRKLPCIGSFKNAYHHYFVTMHTWRQNVFDAAFLCTLWRNDSWLLLHWWTVVSAEYTYRIVYNDIGKSGNKEILNRYSWVASHKMIAHLPDCNNFRGKLYRLISNSVNHIHP